MPVERCDCGRPMRVREMRMCQPCFEYVYADAICAYAKETEIEQEEIS